MALDNRRVVNNSRETTANVIGATAPEIYFTSGGTEANNWAIKGIAQCSKGKHIITTTIEHHSVIHPCEYLQKYHGFSVTYLPVGKNGAINIEDLIGAITPETILISVMFANNETGTFQPIKEVGEIAKEHGIPFHVDAVQAVGHVPVDVSLLNIDLLSMSCHKIYGPKGVGSLYIRNGLNIGPLIHGGAQERNRRAGTENIPGIVGFAAALESAHKEMESESLRLRALSQIALEGMLSIPDSRFNGDNLHRLPHICNVSFKNIEGESLLILLDMQGIAASGGSACTSGSLEPSHVLKAMGLDEIWANGALRISLGKYNTEHDIETLIEKLPPAIEKLRAFNE